MDDVKLFIFDVDNTITMGTSIWELIHQECNTWESHGLKYLNMFKNQEISFDDFIRLDIETWANQKIEVLDRAITKAILTPGFPELMKSLQQKQIKTAVISGTVGQFADYLAQKFGIDYVYANHLHVKENILTGGFDFNVKMEKKGEIAAALIKSLNLKPTEVAAVGDSLYDIPMFTHSDHTFIVRNNLYKNHAKHFVKDFFEINNML